MQCLVRQAPAWGGPGTLLPYVEDVFAVEKSPAGWDGVKSEVAHPLGEKGREHNPPIAAHANGKMFLVNFYHVTLLLCNATTPAPGTSAHGSPHPGELAFPPNLEFPGLSYERTGAIRLY